MKQNTLILYIYSILKGYPPFPPIVVVDFTSGKKGPFFKYNIGQMLRLFKSTCTELTANDFGTPTPVIIVVYNVDHAVRNSAQALLNFHVTFYIQYLKKTEYAKM